MSNGISRTWCDKCAINVSNLTPHDNNCPSRSLPRTLKLTHMRAILEMLSEEKVLPAGDLHLGALLALQEDGFVFVNKTFDEAWLTVSGTFAAKQASTKVSVV